MQIISEKLEIEIKKINFRKTFFEEYANLFNKGQLIDFKMLVLMEKKYKWKYVLL